MDDSPAITGALCAALISQGSCLDSLDDDEARIPIDKDMRAYARDARANLVHLTPRQRAVVEPALIAHERAIARYDRLLAKGKTRRAIQAPLMSAGVFLLADDVTAIGVADDIAIPFLALGALAAALFTSASAPRDALERAYKEVLETGQVVTNAIKSVEVDDADSASSASSETEAKTQAEKDREGRERCIDRYVDCQQNAVRGFGRGGCQNCMDRCIVSNYQWPKTTACDYKRVFQWRRKRLKTKIQI